MKKKQKKQDSVLPRLAKRIASQAIVALGAVGVMLGLLAALFVTIWVYERPTREENIMQERMDQIQEYGGVLRLSALTPWPWDIACIVGSTYEFDDYNLEKIFGTEVDTSRASKTFMWLEESRGAWVFFYKDQKPWAVRFYTSRSDRTGDCVTPEDDYLGK